jgi:lipopolysaccharide export system permease protein
MSILTRNREILALRSCGVSGYRIIAPLILLGACVSGGSLLFEDFVVVPSFPLKEKYAARIRGEQVRGHLADRHNLIVFGEGNVVYRIERYSSREQAMYRVMTMKKDELGNVVFRIDAAKSMWEEGSWTFLDGTVRRFQPDGALSSQNRFERLPTDIRDAPRYFARDVRQVENMTLSEGLDYIQLRRRMGFGFRNEMVKYHRKIATSVTLFFIIIIGLSLGAMAFRNALVMSFSLTLLTVLVFYFIIEIGYTFGSSGRIPPALGGWLGNLVFAPVALYLLNTIRK